MKLLNVSKLKELISAGNVITAVAENVESVNGYYLKLSIEGKPDEGTRTLGLHHENSRKLYKTSTALLKEAKELGIKQVTFFNFK